MAAAANSTNTASDPFIPRFREWIAGILAGLVVLGTVIIMIIAVSYVVGAPQSVTDNDPRFNRIKDLLLFVNPLLGVVIGYYFNKVSTEARAESAEQNLQAASVTAQAAANTAQQATEAQQETQQQMAKVQATATEQKAALANLSARSEELLEGASAGPGTLSLEESSELETQRRNLRIALDQAQRVLAQSSYP